MLLNNSNKNIDYFPFRFMNVPNFRMNGKEIYYIF